MAISFPLTLPTTPGYRAHETAPQTRVGINQSIYTGAQQTVEWQGQWINFTVTLPPMQQTAAEVWAATFMALNSYVGTFYLGPTLRKTSAGNPSGSITVDTGATANSTTLPVTGGSGAFAVGDWIQVGTTTASRLHKVMQVNVGSVDVFPKLRTAYAGGTAITYSNPKGLFKAIGIPAWAYDARSLCDGFSFVAMEVVP